MIIAINHGAPLVRRQSPTAVTRREAEVLSLAHLTYRQIGDELGISPETVRAHMKNIRLKLGAESAKAAMLIWSARKVA